MTSRILAAMCGLALASGCSGQAPDNAGSAQNNTIPAGNAAAGASARDPSGGEAGFRQLADCSATLEATARLYAVLATAERGSRKGELERTAAARRSSAMVLELDARMAGQALGHSIDDVARIKAERHARLEQERERLADFGEFAIWLGRETDRCAALYPSAG